MRRKMITTIALIWLVIMLIILVVYLIVDNKYKKKNNDNTTTTTTTTTAVAPVGDALDIKDIKTFISYTNKDDNVNEISLKDERFSKIIIPSDIYLFCGKQYTYNDNYIDVNCLGGNFANFKVNGLFSFNSSYDESIATEISIYKSNNYYIVYEAAPKNRVGTIEVFRNYGELLFTDLIINNTGLKDKSYAIPFIKDNRMYYISAEYDEEEDFQCAIEYIDFNDNAKTKNTYTYSCNPE